MQIIFSYLISANKYVYSPVPELRIRCLVFFVRRYDTIQDAILVCALKLTKVSLIYHT